MKVTELDERVIQDIGHAFGYYDYGQEHGLICVREPYQGQGYMRKALEIAFGEGIRRDCPVLLETDAVLKRDKYVHLGMKNIRTRKLDDSACLYDLVKES